MRFGPCAAATEYTTWKRGQILLVDEAPYGPVSFGGQPWYVVALANNLGPNGGMPALPEHPLLRDADTDVGWAPASDGATALLKPLAPRCPKTVTFEAVIAMLPGEWLACLDRPFVLEGTYGCGGCGGTGGPIAKPQWLADPFEGDFRIRWSPEFEFRAVGLHFPPSGPAKPTEGAVIRATVHVDDPAAATCSFEWTVDEPAFRVADETAIAWCRERLVVDSYEVLGTDPDYPG